MLLTPLLACFKIVLMCSLFQKGWTEFNNESFIGEKELNMHAHNAIIYLMDNNSNYGWGRETSKIMLALALSKSGVYLNPKRANITLYYKQFEIEVLKTLKNRLSAGELSMHVSALHAHCYDVKDFHGYNLLKSLRLTKAINSKYERALRLLTLCSVDEVRSTSTMIDEVKELLIHIPRMSTDAVAMSVLALWCMSEENEYKYLKNILQPQIEKLVFLINCNRESVYTIALIGQVLIATRNVEKFETQFYQAVYCVISSQNIDSGSFQDLLITYLALPLLNRKSLNSVKYINCTSREDISEVIPTQNITYGDCEFNETLSNSSSYYKVELRVKALNYVASIEIYFNSSAKIIDLMASAYKCAPDNFDHTVEDYGFGYMIKRVGTFVNDPVARKYWMVYKFVKEDSFGGKLKSTPLGISHELLNPDDRIFLIYGPVAPLPQE